jgi:transcriptional regulator with XRE-family HTH domain
MGSKRPRQYYCRCGTRLADDNTGRQCARCQRESRDKLIVPPEVPPEFWQTAQFAEAFAAQHMGRVARAYRTHPYHYAVYGPHGISQTLLGQWLGLSQAQVSRFETGLPLQYLDTLRRWAQVMRIPAELLWFRMPEDTTPLVAPEPAGSDLVVYGSGELVVPAGPAVTGGQALWRPNGEGRHLDDAERDPVLSAPWNHRGTVEVAILLSGGGGRVKRRVFLALSGPALTTPAHQWLVHEPEALASGLAGRRISMRLADRFTAMVAELRQMDDVAGGGSVFTMAQQLFAWVAELLDQASYDEHTGRKLHTTLAELGQFCGWAAYDVGDYGLAQRYNIAGLRAAHSADDRLVGAHVLGSMAKQTAHQGRPAEAATLAETALAGVSSHRSPRLLAQLHVRRAYAVARLQDRSACIGAIAKARAQIEQPDSDNDPPCLYWVDSAWIAVESGSCLLRLDQADQAAAMLHEGITLFDDSFARDRQLYTLHLADARTRPGRQQDLDAAAGLGMASIDLAESLDSTLGVKALRALCHEMTPHAEVPAVREFLERAEGVAYGQA